MSSWLALLCFLVLCGIAQCLGAQFAMRSIADWYPELAKPSWTPPVWTLGPVWTALYALMAFAGWLVWLKRSEGHTEGFPLLLFLLQLILSVFWSVLFFGARNLGWAFYEMGLLWMVALFTIVTFNGVSGCAAALLFPYLAWLTFVAFLNYTFWRMN